VHLVGFIIGNLTRRTVTQKRQMPQLVFTDGRCRTFFSKSIKKVTKHVRCPPGTICRGTRTCTRYRRTLPHITNYKPVI